VHEAGITGTNLFKRQLIHSFLHHPVSTGQPTTDFVRGYDTTAKISTGNPLHFFTYTMSEEDQDESN
jgi:hypothetical protein